MDLLNGVCPQQLLLCQIVVITRLMGVVRNMTVSVSAIEVNDSNTISVVY